MVHISGVFGHGNACPLECRPNLMAITPCDRPPGAHTGTPLHPIWLAHYLINDQCFARLCLKLFRIRHLCRLMV
jgi:hypothetical protein